MKWYLGSIFSRDGGHEIDAKRRIAAGNRVKGALAALMGRRNVSTSARMAVHNAVLIPTPLYGSETSLRMICGVCLADRIPKDTQNGRYLRSCHSENKEERVF